LRPPGKARESGREIPAITFNYWIRLL